MPPVVRLDAQALGTFRVGEPFEIQSLLEAGHDVRPLSFTIVMPQLDDARRTPASRPLERRPSGERYPALDSIGGALGAGEVRRHVTRFPGPVVTESFRSFWVGVDAETAGHVAAGADPTRYPIGMRRQSGPIRAADIALPPA